MLNLFQNAEKHQQRIAIRYQDQQYPYTTLLTDSQAVALELLDKKADLNEARVAFMIAPGFDYVSVLWGIWRAGGIAVPLCIQHPPASLQYTLEDAQVSTVVVSAAFETLLNPLATALNIRLLRKEAPQEKSGTLPELTPDRSALILYTSGTTGQPKGVVTTHGNIEAQITSLTDAWAWQADDHILNVLPLHHVHGIINVVSCALWSGACCEFIPKFNPEVVFDIFKKQEVNVFMAVPTIYYKLISFWDSLPIEEQERIAQCLHYFRLMVSGSAALPISVMEKWEYISGQVLLERYGMTEMGMAISNPYDGERRAGFIGQPLSGVSIRLADEENQPVPEGETGEIQVKGPNVFKAYWNRPQAYQDSFTPEGWFRTGDMAVYLNGSYKILGRNSVDIIKSGGYKISALEIEDVLRAHPQIKDCGVVGIPDEEWGEIIAAALVVDDENLNINQLREWLADKLPNYKMPRRFLTMDDLPRNVMGKVTKQELKKLIRKDL